MVRAWTNKTNTLHAETKHEVNNSDGMREAQAWSQLAVAEQWKPEPWSQGFDKETCFHWSACHGKCVVTSDAKLFVNEL